MTIAELEFADVAVIAAELLDAEAHDLLGVLDVEAVMASLALASRAADVPEYAGLLLHHLIARRALAHGGFGLAVVAADEACRRNGYILRLDPEATRKHVHEIATGEATADATVHFVAIRMRARGGDVAPPRAPRPRVETTTDELLRLYLTEVGQYPTLGRDEELAVAARVSAGVAAKEALANAEGMGNLDVDVAERSRLQQVRTDGEEAERTLVRANLRLVVSIAKSYESSGVPLLDLIQEGNLGLVYAVEKYDWRKGFKFSTYASWWIRQSITRGIANRRGTQLPVRRPPAREVHPDVAELLAGFGEEERRALIMRFGLDAARPRTIDDVVRETGIPIDEVRAAEARLRALLEPPEGDEPPA